MKMIQATSLSLLLASIASIASARSIMSARQNVAPVVNIIAGIDFTSCVKAIEPDLLGNHGPDVRMWVFNLIANITFNNDIYII